MLDEFYGKKAFTYKLASEMIIEVQFYLYDWWMWTHLQWIPHRHIHAGSSKFINYSLFRCYCKYEYDVGYLFIDLKHFTLQDTYVVIQSTSPASQVYAALDSIEPQFHFIRQHRSDSNLVRSVGIWVTAVRCLRGNTRSCRKRRSAGFAMLREILFGECFDWNFSNGFKVQVK